MPQPSKTAAIYRVAYRRADRDPRKGFTYRLFKSEAPARLLVDRLLNPVVTDKTPEKYRDLAPIAECHLHVAFARWEAVEEESGNDLVDHSGEVFVSGEYRSRESAEQRLEYLRTDVALASALSVHDVQAEITELEAALS